MKIGAKRDSVNFAVRQIMTRRKRMLTHSTWSFILCFAGASLSPAQTSSRPRIRDLGVEVGILPPGPLNAITDVPGVRVGHSTLIRGENIRTGVTAILPHAGNIFREKVPGAVFVGNAFGQMIGVTQVNELGEIETPILLTSTLSAPKVADALFSFELNRK